MNNKFTDKIIRKVITDNNLDRSLIEYFSKNKDADKRLTNICGVHTKDDRDIWLVTVRTKYVTTYYYTHENSNSIKQHLSL